MVQEPAIGSPLGFRHACLAPHEQVLRAGT
jgi:hypothetical protein